MADEEDDDAPKKGKKRKRSRGDELPPPPPPRSPAATAGLVSCLTGVVLLLLVLGAVVAVWLNPDLMPEGWFRPWWKLPLIGLLLVVIPIVVFRAVTLWLMGEGPQFAEIEFSWRAGIEAMAKQGITLKSAPLFLVVGGGSAKLRKNLMAASGMDFRVNGIPERPDAPLHWYASRDAIYLYIDDAACLNLAARQYRAASRSPRKPMGPGELPPVPQGSGAALYSTLVPGSTEAASGTIPSSRGAELPDDRSRAETIAMPPAGGRRPMPAYMGTLSPDQVATTMDAGSPAPVATPPTQRRGRRATSDESSLQLRRLEAVCSKLRRYRQPVCPINGVLVLLPFDLLQASRADIEEVERALSADLTTAQRELQIRCPVTALVVAMEQERGFCELIRRIGREHAARQRFGQRFDMRVTPSSEELERFSAHACGIFEEWVYTLFKEDKVLSHPGNPALYNLLCKVRRSFQARLSDVLSKGFSYDAEFDQEPLLFSGCYFAATGAQPERQAFVSGVLNKLRDEQEDLEWTSDALHSNARRGVSAVIGWVTAATLAVAGTALILLL